VDHSVNIPSGETPKIQEGHIMIGHVICAMIEEEIFGAEYNPKRKTA
jgi:D-sedoheptulose 7-phosphate isomerase